MSREVPKLAGILTIASFALGAVLFFVLNSSFGGPTPISNVVAGEPYRLTATFDDAEGLLSKSLVLVNGVQVGEVETVEVRGREALVTFRVDDRYAPVPEGTTVRLGNRTIFGEKYLDITVPSREPLPAEEEVALDSGAAVPSEPSVPLDEALEVLSDRRRQELIRILDEVARGTRSPRAPEQLSATYSELASATGSLRALTEELRGQEDELAGLVDSSRVALTALGDREEALRRIVGAGRVTLEAVASRRESLDRALAELPRTLEVTRDTLHHSRPLLVEARPLVQDLIRAAPELQAVARDVGPVSSDAREVIAGLRPLREAAAPVARVALPALEALLPVAEKLAPATANLVPVARYTGPRADGLSAFFANLAASVSGDSAARWIRLYILIDENLGSGTRRPAECRPGFEPVAAGFCNNAYPGPGDALNNEPFDGTYPRLRPFEPSAPRRG